MRGKFYDGEDARLEDRAAARELYLEALREACDLYAEALTPEQRALLSAVCPMVPCCRRSRRRRRRRRSRRDLSENFAAVFTALGEHLLAPLETGERRS